MTFVNYQYFVGNSAAT